MLLLLASGFPLLISTSNVVQTVYVFKTININVCSEIPFSKSMLCKSIGWFLYNTTPHWKDSSLSNGLYGKSFSKSSTWDNFNRETLGYPYLYRTIWYPVAENKLICPFNLFLHLTTTFYNNDVSYHLCKPG